jgi:hypothetical protein
MKVLIIADRADAMRFSNNDKQENNMENNKPIFSRSIGHLKISIWENLAEGGAQWWNVSLVRRWKDTATGEYRESGTLNGIGDLALALQAVRLAQRFIVRRQDELLVSE